MIANAGTATASAERLPIGSAASWPIERVLQTLGTRVAGLSADEAAARLLADGPNAIRSHRTTAWAVLARQLRSPLLVLLLATASASAVVGERADALIIGAILAVSVGLGFVNEYRAERAAAQLHGQVHHLVTAVRGGAPASVEVTRLVAGDIVHLEVGSIVPADLRLIQAEHLECDESILTGESVPASKSSSPVEPDVALAELSSCVFMGTVVHEGSADGVVVATGARTQFGRIAVGLGQPSPRTEFQSGLSQFSGLLAKVAGALSVAILAINLLVGRSPLHALLFSLAIAVGITPQLLPAVVSTSLAVGSRRLAAKRVLVKRLVCIEDLGDVDVLFTDKTGTLTEGRLGFERAIDLRAAGEPDLMTLGLLCNDATISGGVAVGGNALDVALWEARSATSDGVGEYRRVASAPFDHDRRLASVVVTRGTERLLVTKGAPESVLERCLRVEERARVALGEEFRAGHRVIAVATRSVAVPDTITAADEHDLELAGFLVFLDQPKPSAAASVARLGDLGISVKVVTGDNALVAQNVCKRLAIAVSATLTGPEIDAMSDDALRDAVRDTSIFARISPEQKARIVRAQRRAGSAVAFLGDGVNDALALHHADVGISVEAATDVAKDAADIILLEQDLDVLADGVTEGRRIFANTIKYVRMGTSSNFGNMFSVTVAAAFLPFLPMLPFQILLNNLLYDVSQMTIPTDRVDEEQLVRPSHWDIGSIRRFMFRFGPISSLFDFAMFVVLLHGFGAGQSLFRSGWFVESLATQTLVVFAIRTPRFPFLRSRPSSALVVAVAGVVVVGTMLPESPVHHALGFVPLPARLVAVIAVFVITYLAVVDLAKRAFFRARPPTTRRPIRRTRPHRVQRLASRWTQHRPVSPAPAPG